MIRRALSFAACATTFVLVRLVMGCGGQGSSQNPAGAPDADTGAFVEDATLETDGMRPTTHDASLGADVEATVDAAAAPFDAGCDASTCSVGCCDANGNVPCGPANCNGCCFHDVCFPGIDVAQCGSGGRTCQSCTPSNFVCLAGQCTKSSCGAGNCAGCCFGEQCLSGFLQSACGQQGDPCVDCTSVGATCVGNLGGDAGGLCGGPKCSRMTCPTGCCDGLGLCQGGESPSVCGIGGGSCTTCPAGDQCYNHICVPPGFEAGLCDPQTCPSGCCDGLGRCQRGAANAQCGNFGGLCQDCTLSLRSVCAQQTCTAGLDGGACNAQTCSGGCCDATGQCQQGLTGTVCGNLGTNCKDCRYSSEVCSSQACVAAPDAGASCPAPYANCPAGLLQPALVPQKVCSAAELQNAAGACASGATSLSCSSFFGSESLSNPDCANCLQTFDFDFAAQVGIRACAAPFVSATCNHNSACFGDCITQSCYDCLDDVTTAACRAQAPSGACATYAQGDSCFTQALTGPAALCNPTTYQGAFGPWLQAVGSKYCGR